MPLVGGAFWQGLAAEHQMLLTGGMEGHCRRISGAYGSGADRGARRGSAAWCADDRAGSGRVDAVRRRMLAEQEGLVTQWRMTPEIATKRRWPMGPDQ